MGTENPHSDTQNKSVVHSVTPPTQIREAEQGGLAKGYVAKKPKDTKSVPIAPSKRLPFEVEGTIMEIDWVDSGGQEGRIWGFKEDYTWEPHTHKSVGYFLSVTDDYCYIAQSVNADQYGRVFRIPVSCIKKVRDIK